MRRVHLQRSVLVAGICLAISNFVSFSAEAVEPVSWRWDDGNANLDRTFTKSKIWPGGDSSKSTMPSLEIKVKTSMAPGGVVGTEEIDSDTRMWAPYDSSSGQEIDPLREEVFSWWPYIASECFNTNNQVVFCNGAYKKRIYLENAEGKRLFQKILTLTFVDDGPKFKISLSGPSTAQVGASYPLSVKLVGSGKGTVACSVSWGIQTAALFDNSFPRKSASIAVNKLVTLKIPITLYSENKQYFKVKCDGEISKKLFSVTRH